MPVASVSQREWNGRRGVRKGGSRVKPKVSHVHAGPGCSQLELVISVALDTHTTLPKHCALKVKYSGKTAQLQRHTMRRHIKYAKYLRGKMAEKKENSMKRTKKTQPRRKYPKKQKEILHMLLWIWIQLKQNEIIQGDWNWKKQTLIWK